jgi:hypothetical protein
MTKAPEIIFDGNKKIILSSITKEENLVALCYQTEDKYTSILLRPFMVEKNYQRNKVKPSQNIIPQGRYECAASALAMLVDEKLFHVKRALSKFGWGNDDKGASDEMIIQAGRSLGFDFIELEAKEVSNKTGPTLLTLKSLNMNKMNHALAWTGKEILDPNFNNPERYSWGCEWSPDSLEFLGGLKLLTYNLSPSERKDYDQLRKQKSVEKIDKLKEAIVLQLNSLK